MATQPIFTGGYRNSFRSFPPAFATQIRELFRPGASGSRIHQIHIASNDDAVNNFELWLGKIVTAQSDMGVGTLVDGGGGVDTITRTTGSFADDGWIAGERLLVQGQDNPANDAYALVASFTALTLTLPTGVFVSGVVMPANSALYRVHKIGSIAVAAGAGYGGVASASGLTPAQMPALDGSPDRYLTLAADEVLFGSLDTAVAAGEVLDVTVSGGDY